MWIIKLYHLTVDVVFCQTLPRILCAFENVFKELSACPNLAHVHGKFCAVLMSQVNHLHTVKIVGVQGLALQHGTIVENVIVVVASQVKPIMQNIYWYAQINVQHIGLLTYPTVLCGMWTDIAQQLIPLVWHNWEDTVRMHVMSAKAQ